MKPKSIEELVISKIRARRKMGLKKYGVSMERKDLTRKEWLEHLQCELLDGVFVSTCVITFVP